MDSPLDYQRYGLSQQRFADQGQQFDQNLAYRQQRDSDVSDQRDAQFSQMQAFRQQQAAAAQRLAILRMLPRNDQYVQARAAVAPPSDDYNAALDRQQAWNTGAVASNRAEIDRSQMASMQQGPGNFNTVAPQQPEAYGPQMPTGGGMPPEIAAQQAMEMRMKAAAESTRGQNAFWGFAPGDVQNYDPKTEMATLYPKMVKNMAGDLVPGAPETRHVPASIYAQWGQNRGYLAGMQDDPDVLREQDILRRHQVASGILSNLGVHPQDHDKIINFATQLNGGRLDENDAQSLARAAHIHQSTQQIMNVPNMLIGRNGALESDAERGIAPASWGPGWHGKNAPPRPSAAVNDWQDSIGTPSAYVAYPDGY